MITCVVSESGHQHPSSDPRLQLGGPAQTGPLKLLWTRLDQVAKARVQEGGVLASQDSQVVHGARVQSRNNRGHRGKSRVGVVVVEERGFREQAGRDVSGVVRGPPGRGGRRLGAVAGGHRAVAGGPAVRLVGQECIDAKVLGFFDAGLHCLPLQKDPEAIVILAP